MNRLPWLNSLPANEALDEFLKCCGSKRWAEAMVNGRPYRSFAELQTRAGEVWQALSPDDWLEAFRSHPKIGDRKTGSPVSPQSQQWSRQEQSGVQDAAPSAIQKLAALNRKYEEKFGFIFIVCATGKSSNEIMALLEQRLENDAAIELPIAAAEQARITELRLSKLLDNS